VKSAVRIEDEVHRCCARSKPLRQVSSSPFREGRIALPCSVP